VVWPRFQTALDGWIGSKILLHGSPATVLDRGAPLDDAGDQGGPPVGRLLEGVSYERARCLQGVSVGKIRCRPKHVGQSRLNAKFRADPGRQTHMRREHREGRVRGSFSGERTEITALNNGI